MKPRSLRLSEAAFQDIERRALFLERERGARFATLWADALIGWLDLIAAGGAQLGSRHPTRPGYRTFSYRRQATIWARFTEAELLVVRIYFPGQDWSA